MTRWKHREYPLEPKLLACASRPLAATRYKRDVQLMLADRRQMLGGIAVNEGKFDCSVVLGERLNQIRQETRGERRENPDAQVPIFSATDRRDLRLGYADLREGLATALYELLARLGERNATWRPDEQCRAYARFKVADAAADSRLLHTKRSGGLAETGVIGCRYDIPNMPQFNP